MIFVKKGHRLLTSRSIFFFSLKFEMFSVNHLTTSYFWTKFFQLWAWAQVWRKTSQIQMCGVHIMYTIYVKYNYFTTCILWTYSLSIDTMLPVPTSDILWVMPTNLLFYRINIFRFVWSVLNLTFFLSALCVVCNLSLRLQLVIHLLSLNSLCHLCSSLVLLTLFQQRHYRGLYMTFACLSCRL